MRLTQPFERLLGQEQPLLLLLLLRQLLLVLVLLLLLLLLPSSVQRLHHGQALFQLPAATSKHRVKTVGQWLINQRRADQR